MAAQPKVLPPLDSSLLPNYDPARPGLRPLFHVDATLDTPATIGDSGMGVRKIIPIVGGTIRGPSSSDASGQHKNPFDGAQCLPGGADYYVQDSKGTTRLDARYGFKLKSGHDIYIQSRGTRYGRTKAATEALLSGDEEVDPKDYYFRLRLELETDDPDPLVQEACKSIVVASAVRGLKSIAYDAYILE